MKQDKYEAKVILRWIYDSDIEKLGELQQKQFVLEKDIFRIEENYNKAVKNIQHMQLKQPQITNVREDWGVFLVSPKAIPHQLTH